MRAWRWIAAAAALASAAADAAPESVTIAGSLQSELGCPGDWSPDCLVTALAFDPDDGVWQGAWPIPAGSWEYKAAIDGSWDVNYGANGQLSGANLQFSLAAARTVRFYYDDATHWITDDVTSRIVTAPGSFQSELGCPGDWQPDCLRSWLQDVDGDGVYELETTALPAGSYEVKAAIGEAWDENYGLGGVPNGAIIPFTVPANGSAIRLRFDGATNRLTVPEPAGAALPLAAVAALTLCCARLDSRVNRRVNRPEEPPA